MDKELKALITILESAAKSENKEATKEGIEKVISKLKGTVKETEENGMKNSVIPYVKTPLSDEDTKWDGGAEVKKATGDKEKLYTMHAYVDRSDENFDADESKWYKLPHHKGDGNQELVWKGLSAAVGAMQGARGGVDVPEQEKTGIMQHLRQHYKEFNKPFPGDEEDTITELGLSKDKKTIYRIDNDSESKVDGNLVRAQVLKTKKLIHRDAKGGVLNVTKESIKRIIKNFKDGIIDNVYVPLGHTNDVKKNTGKVVDLIATSNGMDAVIEVRDKGVLKRIKEKLIEKVSASIDENYLNKETGKFVGPVLRHIALVAEPYIKGMNQNGFVFLEEDEGKNVVVLVEETTIEEDLNTIKDTINYAIERIASKIGKDKKMDTNETKNTSDEVKKEDEVDIDEKSDETKEEKTTEEETSNDKTSKDDKISNDEKTSDNKQEDEVKDETSEKEDDSKTETESEVKEEDSKDETSTESESKDKTTEEETESVDNSEKDDEINLAEAEKEYDEFLKAGKVLPVQKNEIVSLLASKGTVNLSEGEKSISELVKSLLEKQKPLDFEEKGAENTDQVKVEDTKTADEADRVKGWYKKNWGYSDEQAQVAFEEYSKINETDGKVETRD